MDWLEDVVLPVYLVIASGLLVLAVAAISYQVWLEATHDCVKSHVESIAGHPMMVGKVIIWVAAHDETVCDEWRPKGGAR